MSKKEDQSGYFNSREGKVNLALFLGIAIVFLLTFLIFEVASVEAGWGTNLTIRTPSNATFNNTASRNMNFTFNITWQGAGQNVSNCSLWVNSTRPVMNMGAPVKNLSANTSDDKLQNYSGTLGTLSYMNFTFPSDGNFTVAISCYESNGSSADFAGFNFTLNRTFVLDTTRPRLVAITPNTTLTTAPWAGADSGNFTGWPITFSVNVSDNNTKSVYYILNASTSNVAAIFIDGTSLGQLENSSDNTLSFPITGSVKNISMLSSIASNNIDIMETFTINISLNFSSPWRGPGAHSVIFCANDSAGNSRCTGSYDFLVTGGNLTQFEESLQSFGSAGSVGINITFGNGTEVPSAANATDGVIPAASFFNPLTQNYTFIFNVSPTTRIHIVGLRIDETMLGNMSNANITTTAQKGVTQAVGSGFATTMAGGEFAKFIPSFVLYKFGVIEVAGVGFNKHLYCTGADLFSSPNCTAIAQCNATAFGANNDSAVLSTILGGGTVSACWLEGDKAQLNGVALTTGSTYTFVSHFSQGAAGNDTGAPEIQFHGSLINNDEGRTRRQTPPSDVSIFNTTSTSILINFTVADLNSSGINMSINNTINVTVVPAGDTGLGAGVFFTSGIGRNLTCFPVGFATNSSVFNITGEDVSGNLTDGVNCTVTVSGLTNGTKNITVTAVDASNNSNRNVTSVLIIVDQIPPRFNYYNFTNSSSFNTSIDNGGADRGIVQVGSSTPSAVPASGDGTRAQGGSIFGVANWTDNLTNPFRGVLQFYNVTNSGGTWQTLNTSSTIHPRNGSWTNFSFPIPTGHNEFEGRNVSFRIIANDTLANVNSSNSVKNFTIQVNDTTLPTVIIPNGTLIVNGTNTTNTIPIISWNVTEPNQLTSINVSVDSNLSSGGVESDCRKAAFYDRTSAGANNVERNRNGTFQIVDDPACTLGNGTHTILIRAIDGSNNIEVVTHTFTVQSASVPGLVFRGVNISSVGAVNNTNMTSLQGVTFNGFGGSVSIANLSYVSSCNTSATVFFTNDTAVYPFNESTCPTESANRTLTVTITDTAGNSNTTVFGFRVDNVAPTIVFHTPTKGSVFNNLTDVNVSAFDSESQVDVVFYYLDGIDTILNHTINQTTRRTLSLGLNTSIMSRSINFTPGTHTIKISVNDTLGNVRNSSVITFKQEGLIDPGNLSESASNYSAVVYGTNLITNVTIRTKTDLGTFATKSGSGQRNLSSENVYEVLFTINGNQTNISITDFNGSNANWDKINITPIVNLSSTRTHLRNNWTNSVLLSISFNNSLEEFITSNDSYFGIVEWPLNISSNASNLSSSPGTAQEFWWVSDETNQQVRINISKCDAAFTRTTSTPCWNYTKGGKTLIFLPHFSEVYAINDSSAPTINVTTPLAIQTVGSFVPNITVSQDAASCVYSINNTVANETMTKSGTICLGPTKNFKNIELNYSLIFTITDANSNINRYNWTFNVTDTTSPNNGAITSSASTTSATVTITGTNETVNATVAYGTTNTSLGSFATQTDFNETQSVSLTSLTADTTYFYNVTVCDFNGNCKTNTTVFSFKTSKAAAAAEAAAAAAAGGGGGGAVAPSAEVASAARRWDSLASGSSAVLAVNNENIAVTGVIVEIQNAVANAEIKVASLTSNPLSTSAAAKVYQYLQLTKSNIADLDASKITINFKVPKSWLSSNGVADSDIVLWRYASGNWNKLETKLVSSDGSFANYEAITPGFSTFAIGNKEAGTSAFAIIDMIRDFYAGTSKLTAFDIIDQIRSFYGG